MLPAKLTNNSPQEPGQDTIPLLVIEGLFRQDFCQTARKLFIFTDTGWLWYAAICQDP